MAGKSVHSEKSRALPAYLVVNKRGKVVSRRASEQGKRQYEKIQCSGPLLLWHSAVRQARKQLQLCGFVPVGGKTERGRMLYAKAKDIYRGGKASECMQSEDSSLLCSQPSSCDIASTQVNSPCGCKTTCKFQYARDQFSTCLIPEILEEMDKLLSECVQSVEVSSETNSSNQRDLEAALKEAHEQFACMAHAVHTMKERISLEAAALKNQMQSQQFLITRLEKHCHELQKELAEQELTACTHQQNRIAGIFEKNEADILSCLCGMEAAGAKAEDLQVTEVNLRLSRQTGILNHMKQELAATWSERTEHATRIQHAAEEIHIEIELAKKLAEDTQSSMGLTTDAMEQVSIGVDQCRFDAIIAASQTAKASIVAALSNCGTSTTRVKHTVRNLAAVLRGAVETYLQGTVGAAGGA